MHSLFVLSPIFLLFNTVSASYPTVGPNAQLCLDKLNQTKVLDKCLNQSMIQWSTKSGATFVERDFCCQKFSEIDCILDALQSTNTGCTPENAQAAIAYKNNVITYWSTGICMTVPNHSPDCAPPNTTATTASPECMTKVNSATETCGQQVMRKWNLNIGEEESTTVPTTENDLRNLCCSDWDLKDCILANIKDKCDEGAIEKIRKGLDIHISQLNTTKCVHYTDCQSSGSVLLTIGGTKVLIILSLIYLRFLQY